MINKDEIDISAMPTPNPNAIKFLLNLKILERSSITFDKKSEKLNKAPIAKNLLAIDGLSQVMIGTNFISITKENSAGWENVLEKASTEIKNSLEDADFSIYQSILVESQEKNSNESDDVKMIKQILDDEIRPAIAQDGGDCQFHSFENGILTLELQGACATCPSSVMTLKMGIESRLKESVPSLEEVIQL